MITSWKIHINYYPSPMLPLRFLQIVSFYDYNYSIKQINKSNIKKVH